MGRGVKFSEICWINIINPTKFLSINIMVCKCLSQLVIQYGSTIVTLIENTHVMLSPISDY